MRVRVKVVKVRGYHEGLLSGSLRWRTHRSAPCYPWGKCLSITAAATTSGGTTELWHLGHST